MISKATWATALLIASVSVPSFAQDAAPAFDPKGSFVDSYGTSFDFKLCGDSGTDLCGVLTTLKGESATPENLAFVGKQVMQAKQSAPNQWKGALSAGGISADATVTQVSPDTIEIQGCRAVVLCQTLAYNRG
ncbi:hypothetical protein WH87_05075 [Devosia epidermidihirudinis]|uniref:DUF2147 domain-containing protein n=1 Tax=Devosia epidermidihirudinis TaxID=1293439 RepID=A0A0F5QFT5_9HYPH|nr:hypothetical protein [Devosia epidermidihirudinis]KKC39558.1 hypothetical protein WH87_05075 [Devosia epidermidihirudinis]